MLTEHRQEEQSSHATLQRSEERERISRFVSDKKVSPEGLSVSNMDRSYRINCEI